MESIASQTSLSHLAFTFGEGRARCGFPQGDIDEAFLADGDDEAAFVLEAAIAIPGFVVLAVLEARGRKIPQAEDAELFVTGGRQVIGIQQECTPGKYIQGGASRITVYLKILHYWQVCGRVDDDRGVVHGYQLAQHGNQHGGEVGTPGGWNQGGDVFAESVEGWHALTASSYWSAHDSVNPHNN